MSIRRKTFCWSLMTLLVLPVFAPFVVAEEKPAPEPYYEWKVEELAINSPLGGLIGNPVNGRKIVISKKKGNCIACHVMPIPEVDFHGNLGPTLTGLATRLSEGQIRLRIVDEKLLNPMTVMPGFYRHPRNFNQVRKRFKGKTVLTAQEIEDVIAYLITLN